MAAQIMTERVRASLSGLAALVHSARAALRQIAQLTLPSPEGDPVADWLYEHWYCADCDGGSVQVSPAWFTVALGAALAGTGRWQPGWVALSSAATDGHIIGGRGQLTRPLRPGEYANIARPGLPVEPGDGLTVLDRLHWLDEPTGFWGARSLDQDPALPHKRLYISVGCEHVCSVLRRLVPQLDAVAQPWALKCPSDPQRFGRADALVVYVNRTHWPLFEAALRRIAADLEPYVRASVPPLTELIATGIVAANSPSNGSSFGQHCCKALATGVRGLLSPEHSQQHQEVMMTLQDSLRTHGIDPSHPWTCD